MTDTLYTATEVINYMSREHNVTLYKQTIWEVVRRHGINPQPTGNQRRLGITREELERLARSYKPRVWSSPSVPQRAPHKPGPSITINEDTSAHRPKLLPRLEQVIVTARREMLAHRRQVAQRMQATGESAYEASTAIRAGWP